MRSKAFSTGVLTHLRSVSLTHGRLLEPKRDTRRPLTLKRFILCSNL
jgi:hypothetical protein